MITGLQIVITIVSIALAILAVFLYIRFTRKTPRVTRSINTRNQVPPPPAPQGNTYSLKSPLWLRKMFSGATRLLGTLIVLYLFVWLLFWITGHKNPIAYITGEQTQTVIAPAGNWTGWIKIEDHWKAKLFYDGKIAIQLKFRDKKQQIVLCEQKDNNGKTLYIMDATTGRLLPMFISDKVTHVRIKSVEQTPISVEIDHRKESFPVVQ